MQNRAPTLRPVPDFTPVPRKHRVDGWTPDRQRAFVVALAETGSVTAAAARINMAAYGAYRLRNAPGAEGFRAAWDAAMDHGVQSLRDLAMERARDGVAQPIVAKGEIIGERRVYDNRLLTFLIRRNDQMDGLAPGTKSEVRREQEAADAASARAAAEADTPEGRQAIIDRLTGRFREMAERLYAGSTDAEIAEGMHRMSAAEIMAIQMFPRPADGTALPERPEGEPESFRRCREA